MVIEIPEFQTHFRVSRNKTKADRYVKLNGQLLYNSNLTRFARNFFSHDVHDYLLQHITCEPITQFPVKVTLDFYAPINFDCVRRKKNGEVTWSPPKKGFNPRFDIDNCAVWLKFFQDCLTKKGIIPDDNVRYIIGSGIEYHKVKDFKERKLVFSIL